MPERMVRPSVRPRPSASARARRYAEQPVEVGWLGRLGKGREGQAGSREGEREDVTQFRVTAPSGGRPGGRAAETKEVPGWLEKERK